jgi:hypothetical protein
MHGPLYVKYRTFIINFDKIFIRFFLKIFIRQVGTLKISRNGLSDVLDSASSQTEKCIFSRIEAKKGGRKPPWLLEIPHISY